MTISYTGGLNFTGPSKGDTNWDTTEDTKSTAISGHDHTAGGKGVQIATAAIATDAVTDTKILLANNAALRARNAANSADLNLVKADTGNRAEFPTVARFTSTETLVGAGAEAASLSTQLTICNKAGGGVSLAAGAEGQFKVFANTNAVAVVITPSVSNGVNTATLDRYEAVLYIYIGSEWHAFGGAGAVIA
jgi:hypothetical protein